MPYGKIIVAAVLLYAGAGCGDSPVSFAEPTTVMVAANTLSLMVGDQAPIAAQVLDQNGRVMQGFAPVFSTDNPGVATVSTEGMVRAVAPGTAAVAAGYGATRTAVRVTVVPDRRSEVHILEVMADSVVADVRGGVQVVAVRATDGLGVSVCPPLSLTSSDPSVATANMGNTCTIEVVPVFPGQATITAGANGRSDTFGVRVTSTGSLVFFSSRPTGEELVAGGTPSYTVTVLDPAGLPVADQQVNFAVSVGTLSPASAITDSAGKVTVRWVIPTELRSFGQQHSISFSTPLTGGAVRSGRETVFINGKSLAHIIFHQWVNGVFYRMTSPNLTVSAYATVHVGVSGVDEYDNLRVEDFRFVFNSTPSYWGCGGALGTRDPTGVEYTCFFVTSGYTITMWAIAPGGMQNGLQVIVR